MSTHGPQVGSFPIPLERMDVRDVLAGLRPFAGLEPAELARLADRSFRLRRGAGTVLIEERARPEGLYVVLRGRVNLRRRLAGDRDLILGVLGPGDLLGETCACDDEPVSSAAVAAVASELLLIPGELVRAHVERHPEALARLMASLAAKLRDIENVASSLAVLDVEARLRRALAMLVRRQGRRTAVEAGWVLSPVPTQSELAKMVGSCRETVSRTLGVMAKNGLLTASGRRMVLSEALVQAAA